MGEADKIRAINTPLVNGDAISYVPEIDTRYYTYGNYNKVLEIIESTKFYPVWITGLAGNGKTQMVEQACARAGLPRDYYKDMSNASAKEKSAFSEQKAKMLENHIGKGREFIRVNFTVETDENDLIGGFRLDYLNEKDGKDVGTKFFEGPVVIALRRGAILLLDEIDVGHTNRIMCLQSVLEGKGVYIKATNEWVKPTAGFQIFATSNTRGRGSEDGKFIGTNIMNAAFLDRFAGTIHQGYPPLKIEDLILKRYFINFHWSGRTSENDIDKSEFQQAAEFIAKLCAWAAHIRDNLEAGTTDEVITTRALINIIQGYSIFKDSMKAIELSCERFDPAIKESFVDMYKKLDGGGSSSGKKSKSISVNDDGEIVELTS